MPSYKDICGGEKIRVHLGFVDDFQTIQDNKIIQDPPKRDPKGVYSAMPMNWEVLQNFFSIYNIEQNWLDCNYDYGYYDEELGEWTGCIGKV